MKQVQVLKKFHVASKNFIHAPRNDFIHGEYFCMLSFEVPL